MKASEIIIKLTELISEQEKDLDVEVDFQNISRVVKPNVSVGANVVELGVENDILKIRVRRKGGL